MAPTPTAWAEAKVRALIAHLVRLFPRATVFSRQVEDRYHVFVIVPYDGSPEKAIQADQAVFRDPLLGVEGFAARLSGLSLSTVLETSDRYELRLHEERPAWDTPVTGGGRHAQYPAR